MVIEGLGIFESVTTSGTGKFVFPIGVDFYVPLNFHWATSLESANVTLPTASSSLSVLCSVLNLRLLHLLNLLVLYISSGFHSSASANVGIYLFLADLPVFHGEAK